MGDIAMARSNSSVSCETEVLQCSSAFPIPKIDFLGKKKAQAKWPQDKLWSSIWSQLAINALFFPGLISGLWLVLEKEATRQERQNNELKMTNFCNTVYKDLSLLLEFIWKMFDHYRYDKAFQTILVLTNKIYWINWLWILSSKRISWERSLEILYVLFIHLWWSDYERPIKEPVLAFL